jgi:CO dehydrogenase/acetyl-CoA synthase beta subunit
MSIKRKEAKILGYKLLYDRTGRLITERTSTDITELKKFLTTEEYNTLNTVVRETTNKLDKIHKYLEDYLNARVMTEK